MTLACRPHSKTTKKRFVPSLLLFAMPGDDVTELGFVCRPIGDTKVSQMSASRFSATALSRTMHNHDLVEDDRVHLHIDTHHMGLGGIDSWYPTVLYKPELYVKPQPVFNMHLDLFAASVDCDHVASRMENSLKFDPVCPV